MSNDITGSTAAMSHVAPASPDVRLFEPDFAALMPDAT